MAQTVAPGSVCWDVPAGVLHAVLPEFALLDGACMADGHADAGV